MLEKLKKAKMVIGFLSGMLAALKELVILAEEEEPEDEEKHGEEKKDAVTRLLLLIYDITKEILGPLPVPRELIEKFADMAIDIIVTLFNIINFFR